MSTHRTTTRRHATHSRRRGAVRRILHALRHGRVSEETASRRMAEAERKGDK